jgi:hypothetical protein
MNIKVTVLSVGLLFVQNAVGQQLAIADAQTAELKPFSTDGCSAFPDGTPSHQTLWLECCTAHDLAYWQGGTQIQRTEADLALEACVSEVGEPRIAQLMLAGVRVGGSPIWPTQFRWGYGWPYPRLYGELNEQEKREIARILNLK